MNDKVNVRMCLVCRKYFAKEKLVRIGKKDEKIFLDKTFKGGGRGTYICSVECLGTAEKTGRISKALKAKAEDTIYREIESELKNA